MKKSEFKSLIKPLITECIKESLMEDGMLSAIIGEVMRGMSASNPIVEQPPQRNNAIRERAEKRTLQDKSSQQLQETRKKLMSSIGEASFNGMDLFEGTLPSRGEASPTQMASPLSGQSPTDAGVDIGNLFNDVGESWTAHMNDLKERK